MYTRTRRHKRCTCTLAAHRGERNADSSRRDRDLHTMEEDRWESGEGLAHQFPRSSGAQARHGSHTHVTRHEHERDPCLTRLASVSSELSNGPVAFPALCTSSPPFVIHSHVRTYYRHVRDEQPANPDSPFIRCIRVVARVVAEDISRFHCTKYTIFKIFELESLPSYRRWIRSGADGPD